MKNKLSVLVLICIFLSLLCGCTKEAPEFLPGEHDGDDNFVWVCEKPFAFFALTDEIGSYHGAMEGYIQGKDGLTCFYSLFTGFGEFTEFWETERWNDTSASQSFCGYGDYYEDYFDLEIDYDRINFFDGELPTLRFYKVDKAEFLKEFGHIEEVSALLVQ